MSYIVDSSENRGNCVFASKLIKSGEFVVKDEKPFVWNCVSIPGRNFHKYCGNCGVVLRSQLFESIGVALKLNNVINGTNILNMIKDLIPVKENSCIPCDCNRNCDTKYCSSDCRNIALDHGHDWLCESLQTSSDSFQQMLSVDEKGHFGLACKVYARIAAQTVSNFLVDRSIDIASEAVRVANAMLAEFHYDDFTRTMHAYRTGRMEIDPSMFESVIFPAYFSAHLATPLALTKDIFAQSGAVLWSDTNEANASSQERSSTFLSSEVFSEQFYSRIIGMFTVNCLSVFVPSPLDFILSEARREQADSGHCDPELVNQVVAFLQRQLQEQKRDEEEEEGEEDVDDEPSRQVRRAGTAETPFLGMSASGLFPTFSKTNHSCLCNTSIHGSDRVTVSIRATEDIPAGAEVTNCYIHHHSINSNSGSSGGGGGGSSINIEKEEIGLTQNEQHRLNRKMTKKQRYRALRQYMFECACPLCVAQEIDSDEDSD